MSIHSIYTNIIQYEIINYWYYHGGNYGMFVNFIILYTNYFKLFKSIFQSLGKPKQNLK